MARWIVAFDVDGTLTIERSIWGRLHMELGTWDGPGKEYYERFFRGEFDYAEWARLDAALWKGIPYDRILKIAKRTRIRKGTEDLMNYLKKHDVVIAAISGGLTILTDIIKEKFNLDYSISNVLLHDNGVLNGKVKVFVEYWNKDKILREIAKEQNISLSNTIFVGNGDNDIPVFKIAGHSIAFNPDSEEVANSAEVIVESEDISDIIPYLDAWIKK